MMSRGTFKLGHPNISAVTTADEVNTVINFVVRETIRARKVPPLRTNINLNQT